MFAREQPTRQSAQRSTAELATQKGLAAGGDVGGNQRGRFRLAGADAPRAASGMTAGGQSERGTARNRVFSEQTGQRTFPTGGGA